jgi:hypothetical protein
MLPVLDAEEFYFIHGPQMEDVVTTILIWPKPWLTLPSNFYFRVM